MGIFGIAKKGFGMLGRKSKSSKISTTVTQPRQLKTTMKKIKSEFKQFGGTKAKTAVDRANIVRKKKSIDRMLKLESLQKKRNEVIQASKDVQKMIGSGQATKIGGQVFHKSVREKKIFGGRVGKPATKQMKGDSKEQKKKPPFDKEDKPATLREKIAPKKKMDRLKELKKELG